MNKPQENAVRSGSAGRLPEISVVIPCRNQVDFLRRALDSLAAQR